MKKIIGWIVSGLLLAGALISLVFALTPQYPEYDDAAAELQSRILSIDDEEHYGSDDPHFFPNSFEAPTCAYLIGRNFVEQYDQVVIYYIVAGDSEGVMDPFVFVYYVETGNGYGYSPEDEVFQAYLTPLGVFAEKVPEWKLYGDSNPAWYFFGGFLVLAGGGISFTFLKKRPT